MAVTYALSIYSRTLTDEEWDALSQNLQLWAAPYIIPLLALFAFKAKNPQTMDQGLAALAAQIFSCDCWHCLALRQKEEITAYDLWLRMLLYTNGALRSQLN